MQLVVVLRLLRRRLCVLRPRSGIANTLVTESRVHVALLHELRPHGRYQGYGIRRVHQASWREGAVGPVPVRDLRCREE